LTFGQDTTRTSLNNMGTRFLLLATGLAAVWGVPQRNAPRRGACVEFRNILADDYTVDEEFQLIEDFKVFLQKKKQASRGQFTDFESGQCSIPEFKYTLEDPDQCDKYWECNVKGNLIEKLCPDGSVYDIPGKSCNHPQRVNCTSRPLLQEPVDPHPACPRLNGYFYTEDEACDSYVECRDGAPQSYSCSTGLVYSLDLLSCVHPIQSGREKCIQAIEDNKSFKCNDAFKTVRGGPKWGNHERFPNPDNCVKFYICVVPKVNGLQLEGSCSDKPGTLFHPDPEKQACLPADEVKADGFCLDFEFPEE